VKQDETKSGAILAENIFVQGDLDEGGNMFFKKFNNFTAGLEELCKVSSSAVQALEGEAARNAVNNNPLSSRNGGWGEEILVAMKLAANVVADRPTGNGVGWGHATINLSPEGISYQTRGGLGFGWSLDSSDYRDETLLPIQEGNRWKFFVQHPAGQAPENSSLRESALRQGWRGDEDELPSPEPPGGLLAEKLKVAMAATQGENRTA